MKHSTGRRALSLLLSLLLLFSLAPTALLEGEDGDEEDPTPPAAADTIFITVYNGATGISSGDEANPFTLDVERGPTLSASISAQDANGRPITTHDDDYIVWTSADESIAKAVYNPGSDGHTFYVEGVAPGNTKITGITTTQAGVPTGGEFNLFVTVSGIVPVKTEITLQENEAIDLPDAAQVPGSDYRVYYYGDAAKGSVEISSDRPNVVRAVGNDRSGLTIDAVSAGPAVVTIQAGIYHANITVNVESNDNLVITPEDPASVSEPLRFSSLEKALDALCQEAIQAEGDKSLVSITSLSVPPAQGTLYLGYQSVDSPGAGVGTMQTLYVRGEPKGPYISDVVFVPNPAYTKEEAVITFAGTARNGRTFKGKIKVKIAESKTDVTLTAAHGQPLPLTATPFSKVCQEETGSPLSYVIFTLPPAAEGVLYRDWKSELDYGSRVSAMEQYSRKDLEQITFVPAQGFVGTVTIGYAGYSTTGTRYNGQLVIVVTRELDRGLQYNDYGAGYVSFDGGDFDDYSTAVTGKRMDFVSFTPPPASQGTLYRSWRSGRGTAVESGDTFGLKALDSVTFVAAEGFHGVVRVPFTGEDRNGVPFSGTVEIHIQSSGGGSRGDIYYTCAPGGFVKLALSDFNNLSMDQTGQRLHYITFQTLPDFNQGALYHNRTSANGIGARVTTTTKYFQSATPYLANLSFWASEGFHSVEIPFTGCAVNGQTFTGLLSIDSGSSSGGSGQGAVSYTTTGRAPAAFSGGDFDSACRAATGSALHYLVFSLPSSAQGMLCFQQQTGGTSVSVGTGEQFYLSGERGLSKISFVPAYGFSGVSVIPFTGWAIDGRQFQGTVEVNVRAGATSGSTVRYATFGTPVQLSAADFQAVSGGSQPSAIRFDATPDQNAGRLYYQYVSPTKYSWQSNTTAAYSLAGDPALSNLTFIPKAGFTGTMAIPYTATCYDGTSYTGRLEITVQAPSVSASFTDLTGYSAQTKAAVDYLSSQGIVNGMQPGVYGPGLSIRRGDFCLMLYRAFRFDRGGTILSFADVPQDAYYAEAVNILSSLGIVNGTGTNRFQPNANISRQDAALMVQRTLRAAGMTADVPGQLSHADANQVTGYAQGAVTSLVQLGIYPTTDTGRLNPKGDLTRSDMAVLLHRTMTR